MRDDDPSPRTGKLRSNAFSGPVAAQTGIGSPERQKEFSHREVARKLMQEYAQGNRDQPMRHLDALHSLVKYLMQNDPKLYEMLQQTAKLVYTQFNIKEVSIAIRSPSDGLYRYVVQHGMRANVWAALGNITYSAEDLKDTKTYKPVTVSRQTQLFLIEDNPYAADETATYSEHFMKQSKRASITDSIEGDYIDVYIHGPHEEALGWIELSGTWDSKIPDASAIRFIETVASVLGIAIMKDRLKDAKVRNATEKGRTP